MRDLVFPKDFVWGTATAAHQVEGDNKYNDWWAFEQVPGNIQNGDKSGKACNHYEMYEQDFDLIQSMGHGAYRFSIEWSRIEPREGEVNQDEINHYRDVLQALKERGIKSFVTLHHFTSPLWFAEKGGFSTRENLKYYLRYVERVAHEYRDLVHYWATFNEPEVVAYAGYWTGAFPPGRKNILEAMRTLANFIIAHGQAYRILKSIIPNDRPVGIVNSHVKFEPARSGNRLDYLFTELYDYLWSEVIFSAIETGWVEFPLFKAEYFPELKGSTDFWGINYYFCMKVDAQNPSLSRPPYPAEERTDMGWRIYPQGLYEVIERMARYGKPIYITENGIATEDDRRRIDFLIDHLRYLHLALQAGFPVKGYFHWSLIDNFEWNRGFAPKFGLVAFDPKTFERRVKPSGRLYGEVARSNRITEEMIKAYL